MSNIPELEEADFGRSMKASQRRRIMHGQIESGEDIVALRLFVGLSQAAFASALGISVHTLRNWEQGRRAPEGPTLALLRIAARHPSIAGTAIMQEGPRAIAVVENARNDLELSRRAVIISEC